MEEVEEQSVFDLDDVYTEYPDQQRDEWTTKLLARVQKNPDSEFGEVTGN